MQQLLSASRRYAALPCSAAASAACTAAQSSRSIVTAVSCSRSSLPAASSSRPAAAFASVVRCTPSVTSASTALRSLHSSPSPRLDLDAQTHKAAAAWNIAARLGDMDQLLALEVWLQSFKKDSIPSESFEIKHARSSGAGGQNVNKVNTKVDLRFKLDSATWMPVLARKCLKEAERARLNNAGEFVVTSERTRTQAENFEDCVEKLYAMIKKSCELPKATDAAKVDRIKKLEDANRARRRENKEFKSSKKASRRDWRE